MFPSISFPLGSICSFNVGALRSTVVTRFNATTAPSDSCPDRHPSRPPKFLAELSARAIPLCPAMPHPSLYHCFFSERVLASCILMHSPHGICITRLYPWVHFRCGSHICEREASPGRSPFTMLAPLLMQWSIHKANTFQFASSAKLCLAHQDDRIDRIGGVGLSSVDLSTGGIVGVGDKRFIMHSSFHFVILNLFTAPLNCRFFPRESPRSGVRFSRALPVANR